MTVGVALSDTVVLGGFKAYAVSVIPGSLYKISITGVTDDADLLVFGTDNTFTTLAQCAVDNTAITGFFAEDCIIAATDNVLFFAVEGAFLSTSIAAYTIAVEELFITDLNLSIPILDITSRTGAVVYAVPVTPGSVFTVAITGLDNDADLYVFQSTDAFIAPSACTIDNTQFIGTTPEDCTLTSDGDTLYFIVDAIFSTAPDVLYAAFASPAPALAFPASEGFTGAPVALSIDTPAIGQVGFAGSSYYVASGLTPGTRYTVSINGLTNDADLTVYNNDNTFAAPASCLINNISFLGTTAESCTLTAAGSSIYFKVTAETAIGGVAFIHLIEPGP